MKLVVGMGTIDDYPALVEAGADEVFCGYISAQWGMRYGDQAPMNRREVLYPNVQIGSESELAILARMQEAFKVPVTLTLNAPYYMEDMLLFLQEYAQRCSDMGFQDFIIADENLIHLYDCRQHISNKKKLIHLSGEYGELNRLVLDELNQYAQIKRIIFPRQTTIEEMKRLIPYSNASTFEAFFLNEKCHYTGAYCNSIHSDFFCHMCQVPYQLEKINHGAESNDATSNDSSCDVTLNCSGKVVALDHDQEDTIVSEEASNASGCGYCALWKLRDAGITHLKIVSRGNYVEDTIKDVKRARKALAILEASSTEQEYIQNMKEELFPEGCSKNCYYL